jgi:dihydrolipoamide dehydrogenase
MAEIQDVVVIGGGAGGFAAAMRAAQLGGKVTVIESTHYGGNCMNKACIPLTFLLTAAGHVTAARKAARFGVQIGEPTVDMETLHERKDLLVEGLRMGTEQQLADHGVTLVEGRGKLLARDTVEVDSLTGPGSDQQIRTRNVILATGSVPAQLPIEGADLPGVLGTEEAIQLREIPGRLAVVSGEPWDVELAQYFHAMGSETTLILNGDRLLPQADRNTDQRLAKRLYDTGIAIRRRASVEAIRLEENDSLKVVLAGEQGEVISDKVLAARRLSNSAGLGLRQVGVEMDGASVLVDERMATNVPGVYAIGDVTAGVMRSHKANSEGIIAAENAMGLASLMNYDILPHCAYTWPQVAWVGMTEEEAEAQGIEVDVGKVPVALNPHAMILDETAGEIKVIASKRYGKVLGAHMVTPGAVDLINAVALAMLAEATVHELMRFIPRHPSLGEALVDAAMDVEKRSLHMPKW